ncbi:MAG: formylglycine-generating enzyme family protein [Magnetococcales bacterium]|nr:formylglycine-generating enzyme family protein [Magnetococcales bacterium]MBF0631063.1 formylglycine-generating enzyme family protein [Magnetococcales bacterium]
MSAARWAYVLVFMIPGMVCAEPEKTLTNNINMEFVLISSGTFMMGEPGGDDDTALHEVILSTPFCIGKYEVTQTQWQAVMGNNPSIFKGSNRPVENVSWNDVHEFIKRLNIMGTDTYRLPTEAEWEYAARAGTTGHFYWGRGELTGDYAWYDRNSRNETQPVGQKLPNPWGLYDMAGNVWEWCQDWYDKRYGDGTSRKDPMGPVSGVARVYRGGSWIGDPMFIRHANRSRLAPDRSNGDVGFRLVMRCHPSLTR